MMKNRAAIVLARLDSKRFPGKAMHKIHGKPLISYCILPLLNSSVFDVILATSDRAIDAPLVLYGESLGIKTFRGSCENISERVKDCINHYEIESFARVNGDSPFVRKELLENGFNLLDQDQLDLVTNLVPRTYPYGISVEVIRSTTFNKFKLDLVSEKYKEHFTTFFYDNIQQFKFENYSLKENLSNIRLTVDEHKDVSLVEYLFAKQPNLSELPINVIVSYYYDYLREHLN